MKKHWTHWAGLGFTQIRLRAYSSSSENFSRQHLRLCRLPTAAEREAGRVGARACVYTLVSVQVHYDVSISRMIFCPYGPFHVYISDKNQEQ